MGFFDCILCLIDSFWIWERYNGDLRGHTLWIFDQLSSTWQKSVIMNFYDPSNLTHARSIAHKILFGFFTHQSKCQSIIIFNKISDVCLAHSTSIRVGKMFMRLPCTFSIIFNKISRKISKAAEENVVNVSASVTLIQVIAISGYLWNYVCNNDKIWATISEHEKGIFCESLQCF